MRLTRFGRGDQAVLGRGGWAGQAHNLTTADALHGLTSDTVALQSGQQEKSRGALHAYYADVVTCCLTAATLCFGWAPPTTQPVKVFTGSVFVPGPLKHYDGASWVAAAD